MSRIEELIREKCPNVVKKYKLSDIVKFENGKGHEKVVSEDGKYILLTSKAISTNLSSYRRTDQQLSPLFKNDITMVMSDLPNGRALAKCFLVNEDNIYTLNQRVCKLTPIVNSVNPKYLCYLLNRNSQLLKYDNGVDQTNLRKDDILRIELLIPPVEVQEEIVRILDKFGELEAKLESELESELEARKKQYEFWRGKLFENNNVKKYRLDELFNLKNGFTPSKSNDSFWKEGTIPWFRMEDIRENGRILNDAIQHVTVEATKGNIMPVNSIIVSTSATIGEHALLNCESLSNQRFTYLMLKEQYKDIIDIKYIYFHCFLLDQYCLSHLNQGNFASVDMNAFKSYIFSIPPLNKQKRIVNILDKFDKLINDISEGLPAEIEARRKQYEYYRNKLLSFEEVSCE